MRVTLKQANRSPAPKSTSKSSGAHRERAERQIEPVADHEGQAEEGPLLVALTWPTRLTIILVGASLLFSIFFGLEFFVAKLVASRAHSIQEQTTSGEATVGRPGGLELAAGQQKQQQVFEGTRTRIDFIHHAGPSRFRAICARGPPLVLRRHSCWWSRASEHATNEIALAAPPPDRSDDDPGEEWPPRRSKLGVDFELIYERELGIEPDGRHFKVNPAEGQREETLPRVPHPPEELLVQPELKLRQLLEAYQAAMPFDPDIWTLSEPARQARELLTGHLLECHSQLESLTNSIGRALGGRSGETAAGSGPGPLARVGPNHLGLMRLLDAMGRPEAGTLTGHPFWLGSYAQCLSFNDPPAGRKLVLEREQAGNKLLLDSMGVHKGQKFELKTRYCVGKLALKSWLAARRQAQVPAGIKLEPATIKVGLCLPRACDSLELFRHAPPTTSQEFNGRTDATNLEQDETSRRRTNETIDRIRQLAGQLIKFNLNERIFPPEQVELLDVFCLPERRQLGALAFLLLLGLALWLALLVACTRERARRRSSSGEKSTQDRRWLPLSDHLLECLAIDANFEAFARVKGQPRGEQIVNLNTLDSVKHLGCVGVIMAHVLLTHLTLGSAFQHTIETIGRDMRTMLLLSLNNIVDTFFVISGLLVAYLTSRRLSLSHPNAKEAKVEKVEESSSRGEKAKNWTRNYLRIVVRRYARMAPLYFLVYAFAKCLSVHLGEGPLWDYATNNRSIRGLCRQESWFWPLVFASDLKPLTHHCVPPAWSISVDMQFFLLVPLLVQALALVGRTKRQALRATSYALLGCAIAISCLLTLSDYKSIFDFVSPRDFAKLRLHVFTVLIRHAAHAYSQPQNRMGPILIGLMAGHLLFEYERRKLLARRGKPGEAQGDEWPFWMRGRWFRATLWACLAFVLAPCLVQVRERARHWLAGIPQTGGDQPFWFAQARVALELSLALKSSDLFDCHLALGGLVLIKPLWSMANCLIFMRLMTDLRNSAWARLMSLPVWQVLSKLNYAILLIHFELIAYEAMARLRHDQVTITWSNLATKFAFAYLFSLLLALPLFVLFEQPLHRLLSGEGSFPPPSFDSPEIRKAVEAQVECDDERKPQSELGASKTTTGRKSPQSARRDPGGLRRQLEDMQEESRARKERERKIR